MNLMFWKKNPTTEDSEDDSRENTDGRTGSKQSSGRGSRDEEVSDDADDETINPNQTRLKRGLIVGAAVGVIILAAAGLIAWKHFMPPPPKNVAKVDVPEVAEPMPLPGKQLIKLPPIGIAQLRKAQSDDRQIDTEALKKNNDALRTQVGTIKAEIPQIETAQAEQQANIDALTRKNRELQAQIDALNKNQPHPTVSPTNQAAAKGKAQPPTRSGDTAISNKNPKAAAMTVKELIDAMNASSGNTPQKPTK